MQCRVRSGKGSPSISVSPAWAFLPANNFESLPRLFAREGRRVLYFLCQSPSQIRRPDGVVRGECFAVRSAAGRTHTPVPKLLDRTTFVASRSPRVEAIVRSQLWSVPSADVSSDEAGKDFRPRFLEATFRFLQ